MRESILSSPWWRQAVFYQIYPRSFADSNQDGVGDLEGIRQRLGYLKWLGVDAVWINPFFPSPMEDFGYDITDYCSIDPAFGCLNDFDRLLAEAHDREIRVILDLVANHTSIEHSWFKESRPETGLVHLELWKIDRRSAEQLGMRYRRQLLE